MLVETIPQLPLKALYTMEKQMNPSLQLNPNDPTNEGQSLRQEWVTPNIQPTKINSGPTADAFESFS